MEDSTADAFTVAHARTLVFGDFRSSIDAAVMALLDGDEALEVAELAGASPSLGWSEARALVRRAHSALGLDYRPMSDEDAQVIALRVMVMEHRSGARTLRELTSWAHDVIRHGSSSRAVERMVQLEDDLEVWQPRRDRVEVDAVLDAFLRETADAVSRWRPAAIRP
ncbi:hypothetical protein [Agrococcus jenensis]|uniref:Uncharacterized protein n=1 Tax=Agrococcus jenensis TaxID=46353 RepID=A0A3N2AT83_9MICO|nr:hypothetical protein [Agrococcus jenensis]ROR66196.1 hypothetical protein EDD26_1575 [Agrococcus jenensis]